MKGGPLGRRDRGLTLAEILVAASVMSVALLAITSMFPTGYETILSGGQMTKATRLAQEMMEGLRNQPFDNLITFDGVDTRNPQAFPAAIRPLLDTWRCDITPPAAGCTTATQGGGLASGWGTIGVTVPSSGLAQISVTVGWRDRRSSKTVGLVTYAAR